MPAYPRKELEEMVERWLEANKQSEQEGDWIKHLGAMYTDDAEYSWNMGPNREFIARGRKEIEDWALGAHMEGFEKWRYPYEKIIIDDQQGEIIGIWRQVAPVKRADGSEYEVAGVGGSWFRYGGDFKWCWQRDFFDLGNVKTMFMELAADGQLDASVMHVQCDSTIIRVPKRFESGREGRVPPIPRVTQDRGFESVRTHDPQLVPTVSQWVKGNPTSILPQLFIDRKFANRGLCLVGRLGSRHNTLPADAFLALVLQVHFNTPDVGVWSRCQQRPIHVVRDEASHEQVVQHP